MNALYSTLRHPSSLTIAKTNQEYLKLRPWRFIELTLEWDFAVVSESLQRYGKWIFIQFK